MSTRLTADARRILDSAFTTPSLMVCVFGGVSLLKFGEIITFRSNSKSELMLGMLALRPRHAIQRDVLLETLWPGVEPGHAHQSLHSLVYSFHRLLHDVIGDEAPLLYTHGAYQLSDHIAVDATYFEQLISMGDASMRSGDRATAIVCFEKALALYSGDVSCDADSNSIIERERLRARYLSVLARVAHEHFEAGNLSASIGEAQQLLRIDPCREDAHRMVMRVYTRLGERAQALRQYQICERILNHEYNARPEPATLALYDQIRLDPSAI